MRLPTQENLNKWQTIATITSLILVPLIVAFIGWRIQENTTDESIKKDYVQMAINVLAEPKASYDEDLRKWSIDVLSKNSPVPFSAELRKKLWVGATLSMFAGSLTAKTDHSAPPKDLMKPPLDLLPINNQNNKENMRRTKENAEQLKNLQEWVKRRYAINSWDDVRMNLGLDKQ
jgi:hypothetical protein